MLLLSAKNLFVLKFVRLKCMYFLNIQLLNFHQVSEYSLNFFFQQQQRKKRLEKASGYAFMMIGCQQFSYCSDILETSNIG